MADIRQKAVATANTYDQGDIAGLDAAMTRRLIASTVLTESHGGDLAVEQSTKMAQPLKSSLSAQEALLEDAPAKDNQTRGKAV